MANNIVDYIASLRTKHPDRANWLMDMSDVGTNTFGFIKVRKCVEVIAGSHLTYDFKSAYSSNPTISPVLSRGKVSVCAIWVPLSLYIPAFRDGVSVKAGEEDYSFPTINFNYNSIVAEFNYQWNSGPGHTPTLFARNGVNMPYIPANSIFTELRMWRPYFQPAAFALAGTDTFPEAKNAIPLLGYYDFFRHYVLNRQSDIFPIRTQGYSVVSTGVGQKQIQEPVDFYQSIDNLDNLFTGVRRMGLAYPRRGAGFDISNDLTRFLGGTGTFAPLKKLYADFDSSVPDPLTLVAFNDDHYGEVRQTYLGDYYVGYLSNENVEYERTTARVNVGSDGTFTMEELFLSQRIQSYIRKTVFKNSDYSEFIDAHYGVTPPTMLSKPLILGKVSSWITFNDVISTATTSSDTDVDSNSMLGSRSSLGFGRMLTGKLRAKDERHFVNFTAKEPGYFMVLEWIIPEVNYFQGFDPLYDKRSLNDLYFPEFDRSGYQDKQFKYLNEQIQDPDRPLTALPPVFRFDRYNFAYAQEPAFWEYMSTYNTMSGQMVDPSVYRHWVFHREVDPDVNFENFASADLPTEREFVSDPILTSTDIYVKPEDYQHIFANEQGLDNFQTFYKHDLKLYQPLSHRFLSF